MTGAQNLDGDAVSGGVSQGDAARTPTVTGRRLPDRIALLVSRVDGTLVTPDKVLTAQAAAACAS